MRDALDSTIQGLPAAEWGSVAHEVAFNDFGARRLLSTRHAALHDFGHPPARPRAARSSLKPSLPEDEILPPWALYFGDARLLGASLVVGRFTQNPNPLSALGSKRPTPSSRQPCSVFAWGRWNGLPSSFNRRKNQWSLNELTKR